MEWDPGQYLKFDQQRTRPALDLMARVPAAPAGRSGNQLRITDLGCGPGTVTRLLHDRWPGAWLTGVDGSGEMLSAARRAEGLDRVEWHEADITKWAPVDPQHLIFSNAVFHWLDRHDVILPRLMGALGAGGILAVQMAANHGAPSHQAIFDLAESKPWADTLAPLVRRDPVARPEFYYELLGGLASQVDIWSTEYLYLLEGDNPVVEWVKGSILKPFLDMLDAEQQAELLADYSQTIAAAYPPQPDGRTLYRFRRFFLYAVR
jgi:trans-aconitate 2-methyltransferase